MWSEVAAGNMTTRKTPSNTNPKSTRPCGRISHAGLKQRIEIERRRKKTATIKRNLARRLEKALSEIEELEKNRVGAYAESE